MPITIIPQVTEFMEGTAVGGADVELIVEVVPKYREPPSGPGGGDDGPGGAFFGPVGAGAGYFIGKEIGETLLDESIDEEDIRTKADINDEWTTEQNLPDLERVLDLLFDLANNPHPRAVFVHSGDSHLGAMHVITSAKPEHRRNMSILQLLSSPISRISLVEKIKDYTQAIPPAVAIRSFVASLLKEKIEEGVTDITSGVVPGDLVDDFWVIP